ncbi:MAG: IPTL-CTERM sorting domain-containing protein [candidate division Zixibacteria bacterium]|nr:IPTL-CTERM sorting domain-containing protein [candidate division Zixibacteria bacterium]
MRHCYQFGQLVIFVTLALLVIGTGNALGQVSVTATPATAVVGTPATITITNTGTTTCTVTQVSVRRPSGATDIRDVMADILPTKSVAWVYPDFWTSHFPSANVNEVGTYTVYVVASCSPEAVYETTFVRTAKIPTLTEWGFIIFSVLLVGWMGWVIVRRRRTMTVGI